MKKLTIGLLLDDTLDTPDGVQQYVLTLGAWLTSEGHTVHYIVGDSKRKDIQNLHPLAKVVRLKFNGNRVGTPLPASKKKIQELLGRLKLDVLHVQMPYSPLFAAKVINSVDDSVRVVGSFHVLPADVSANVGSRFLKLLLLRSMRRIDTFIANTSSTAQFFASAWRVNSRVIPNPINMKTFSSKAKYKWDPSKKHIVFLGRIVERKGVLNLIRGYRKLPQTLIDGTHLHIGGKGPLYDRAAHLVDELGLAENATMYGFIQEEDKPKFLNSADITIFPSTGGESFGISLLEPMVSAQSIVLAGQNPGYNAVMQDHNELTFDAGSIEAITASLKRWLLASDADIKQQKKWLRSHVKQYDVGLSVGPQILEAYTAPLQR